MRLLIASVVLLIFVAVTQAIGEKQYNKHETKGLHDISNNKKDDETTTCSRVERNLTVFVV